MSSSPTSSSSSDSGFQPLGAMLDVACAVDLVIGTGSLTVRDCLALQPRSILRLRQASGADLDLSVSGIAIAYAEVVISDDTTAVRITRIAEPPRIETSA